MFSGRRIPFCSALLVALFLIDNSANAQFWQEDFGTDGIGCASVGTNANGAATNNGLWIVTQQGNNGFLASNWYISSKEGGGYDPNGINCGERCNPASLFNRTLHVSSSNDLNQPDSGAVYVESSAANNTDKRAESPTIDCTTANTIMVEFWYAASSTALDRASLEYFDGTTWTELTTLPATGTCTPNSIDWDDFSFALPASANFNPDVKIGFSWVNSAADGVNSQLSVAVDSIRLYSGPAPDLPQPDFEVVGGTTDFCENQCISFNDLTTFDEDFSEGAATATYDWEFNGAEPATSDQQNPTGICYNDPGTYPVTLTVTDNIGESAPVTMNGFITVQDCGPVVMISASQTTSCANEECIDFFDESTTDNASGVTGWLWTFTAPSGAEIISSQENPEGICLNEIGFYDVTLAATDDDLTETQTFPNFIEVLDCSGPDIEFSADRTVICPGDCIQLTDMSTSNGTITSWNWSLPGGQAQGETLPDTSNQQNPLVCYEMAGSFDITLSATDQEGPSAITKTITITVDPCTGPPDAGITADQDTICTGDCVNFIDQSLGLVEEYLWTFEGADIETITSSEENPSVVCYSEPGTYDVTLTVSNSNGQVDTETFENYITVEQCISPPTPRIEVSTDTICAGKCVTYTDASTGLGIDSWQWNFQGAADGQGISNQQNPGEICYNNTGQFDVSLRVEGPGGDSIRVFNDVVTVVTTPECRPQIEVMAPDTICAGTCEMFTANFTDADSVSWIFNGGNPDTSSARNPGLVCYDEVGEYLVIVNAFNPSGTTQQLLEVFVGPRPPLNAGPDQSINSGAVVTLNASLGGQEPVGQFTWQPFELVDDFRAQSVKTSPDETTQYIVYYSEDTTCTAVDTVQVNVNFVAAIGVPTAFSPNGDGTNDQLRVLGQGISNMDFKVYNRYGQLVFETTNQEDGWDGTQNGKELNPGTFVYTLEVRFAEGNRETYTGNTTLVR